MKDMTYLAQFCFACLKAEESLCMVVFVSFKLAMEPSIETYLLTMQTYTRSTLQIAQVSRYHIVCTMLSL